MKGEGGGGVEFVSVKKNSSLQHFTHNSPPPFPIQRCFQPKTICHGVDQHCEGGEGVEFVSVKKN